MLQQISLFRAGSTRPHPHSFLHFTLHSNNNPHFAHFQVPCIAHFRTPTSHTASFRSLQYCSPHPHGAHAQQFECVSYLLMNMSQRKRTSSADRQHLRGCFYSASDHTPHIFHANQYLKTIKTKEQPISHKPMPPFPSSQLCETHRVPLKLALDAA